MKDLKIFITSFISLKTDFSSDPMNNYEYYINIYNTY